MYSAIECRVLPNLNHDVVLGIDWLSSTNPTIDWWACTVAVNCEGLSGPQVLAGLPVEAVARVELCSARQVARDLRRGCEGWIMLLQPAGHVATMEVCTLASSGTGSGTTAGAPETDRWERVVSDFTDVFEPPGMPVERDITHRIELLPGSKPTYRRQYRVSAAELAEVRRQLDEYLEKGWIRPSSSPYGAPIVFIRKKTGELRMTVDYRALNNLTRKDVYPLPRIDDLLDKLSKAHYLSAIDLASGYH